MFTYIFFYGDHFMILGRGKCKFKEDGIRALPGNAKTSQNWESTRLNSASLGRNFSINLREKGFKTKTKQKNESKLTTLPC